MCVRQIFVQWTRHAVRTGGISIASLLQDSQLPAIVPTRHCTALARQAYRSMQLSQRVLRLYAKMETTKCAVTGNGMPSALLQHARFQHVDGQPVYRARHSHLKILNAPQPSARVSQTAVKSVGLRPV